ncbi:MAG: putative toxin-antitoxin system toxin component, PIN family [Desulfonatronovibrio sp.]
MIQRVFVVDTNIFIAGLITSAPKSPTALILDAMLKGNMAFLLSPELLSEYRNVLLRPKIARIHNLNMDEVDQVLVEITANAVWREIALDTGHSCPDPGDSHLWALLDSEPSAILVTGDQLLVNNPRPGSSVISPAAWLVHFSGLSG